MEASPTGPAPTTATTSPGLDPPVPHADLEAGGQDVGQHDGGLVGDAGGELVERVVAEGDPDVLRLGAVDEMPEDPADPGRSLIGEAVGVEPLVAVGAGAARADAGDQHPVADLDRVDGRTDLGDRADAFVAEDASLGDGGDVALQDVQVGAADRRGVDPNDHVRRLQDRGIRYLFPRFLAGAVVDERLHD